MLEKQIINDKIEILEDGTIQIREVTRILEDGISISEKITNRKVIDPGGDTSLESQEITNIAGIVHTVDRIKKHKDKIEKRKAKMGIENNGR